MESTKEKIYTVSEITSLIRIQLEDNFPTLTIEGEVSNFRPSSTGHYYFTLKDPEAVISVVMFKNRTLNLNFSLKDGMMVRAFGSISVYAKRGNYQLICESLVQSGEGELLAVLEERKRRLAEEGLFAPEKKKALPLLPKRIGVVTSPTGAAIRDILRVLKRRNAGVNLIILPTPVQGDNAGEQIAEQIRLATRLKLGDVLIVGRGGGSLEDLLPFSDEAVVRAIADSDIPVISSVGHEIDYTLSDFAADVRAPTPSAAAEMVAASRDDLLRRITKHSTQMTEVLNRSLEKIHHSLSIFSRENLQRNFNMILSNFLLRFDDVREKLANEIKEKLTNLRHKWEILANELLAQSPLDILKRGYAVVTDRLSGKILRSSEDTEIGKDVDIRLHTGQLLAEIKEKSDEILRRKTDSS